MQTIKNCCCRILLFLIPIIHAAPQQPFNISTTNKMIYDDPDADDWETDKANMRWQLLDAMMAPIICFTIW